MGSNTKFSLHQLTQSIQMDLDEARENAKLSAEVECFQDQKDFWDGKVEAFEHVMGALEKATALINNLENRKDNLITRLKVKFAR